MIEPEQLQLYVVRPTLQALDLHTAAAEALLMGTIAQESSCGTYIHQLGTGPALGICQMEPVTYDDIWNNFLKYRANLVALLYDKQIIPGSVEEPSHEASWLIPNLAYAVAMCRIDYLRKPGNLPHANDVPGMAAYWKKYYNTPLGQGTEEEFIANFNKYLSKLSWGP